MLSPTTDELTTIKPNNLITCVAFDPGKTTGYCVATLANDSMLHLIDAGEVAWGERLGRIRSILVLHSPQAIIMEEFRLYPSAHGHQTYSDFPSVRVIGAVEALAFSLGLESVIILQPASIRKRVRVLDNHRHIVGSSVHSQDAYRHLRYAVVSGRLGNLPHGVKPPKE